MNFKTTYASEQYVDEAIANSGNGVLTVKTPNMTQLVGVDEDGLVYASKIFDGIILKDAVSGYEYVGEIRDGNFVTYCRCDHIEITQMPNKTEYVDGDAFDSSGMIITAISQNGLSKVLDNYVYPNSIQIGMEYADIQYIECGMVYSVQIPVSVREFDPAVDLIDFNYTDNGDGTYTLTGWKQTLNGTSSTELIVPDSRKIKM